MTHDPKARIQRQRDSRKQERRQERHTDNAATNAIPAAYNRDGLAGITEALGAGDPAHWDTDSERGQADE